MLVQAQLFEVIDENITEFLVQSFRTLHSNKTTCVVKSDQFFCFSMRLSLLPRSRIMILQLLYKSAKVNYIDNLVRVSLSIFLGLNRF